MDEFILGNESILGNIEAKHFYNVCGARRDYLKAGKTIDNKA